MPCEITPEIRRQVLRDWLVGEFRQALRDRGRVLSTGAMLKVAIESGAGPEKALATAIGDFVRECIDPSQPVPDGQQ